MQQSAKNPCALVFAGGGSHGAVQAGMLGELVNADVTFDFTVGASAGAINAAYFARHPTAPGVAQLQQLWRGLRRSDIMPLSARSAWNVVMRRDSIFTGGALRAFLSRHLPNYDFSNAALPLHVVACDQQNGAEVVISDGLVIDALMASAAIPGVFPCVSRDGRSLVDGGVTNNTPISTAVRLGAKRIIVLSTGYACALRAPLHGAISHMMNALNHLVSRQLVADIAHYRDTVEILVIPSLCPLDISSYDYSKAAWLIDHSAMLTAQWLSDGGLSQPESAHTSHQHLH